VLQVINSSLGDLAPVFTIRLPRGKHWATTRDGYVTSAAPERRALGRASPPHTDFTDYPHA